MDIYDFPGWGGRRPGAGRKPLPKQYEVLAVAAGGIVQLVDLNSVRRAISRNTTWARTDESLTVGMVVEGRVNSGQFIRTDP